MSKRSSIIVSTSMSEHPAVLAFQDVFNTRKLPSSIEPLQLKPARPREVWRLAGCGPAGKSMIAKRCEAAEAERELNFYQRVLTKLPVLTIECYGHRTAADNPDLAWMFLEDVADDEPYSIGDPDQHRLIGHWIAKLHTCGQCLSPEERSQMLDRGPDHFRPYVHQIISAIEEYRSNRALSERDRTVLDKIDARCEEFESNWAELALFCAQMPHGVIHGDLKCQHIFWARCPRGLVLRLIDWGVGGWGSIALDLVRFLGQRVQADAHSYLEVLREQGFVLDPEELYRLFYVGQMFVALASAKWDVDRLRYPWVLGPMSNLCLYADWMEEIAQAAPWSAEPGFFEARQPRPRPWD